MIYTPLPASRGLCTPDIIKLKIILMTPSVHASLPNSYSNTIFPKQKHRISVSLSDNLCPYAINRLGSSPVVLHLRMKFPPRTYNNYIIKSIKVPKGHAIVYFPYKIRY